MPKRKNWSDEEWVFLLEMAERPEVSQILALIGPSRRGPPPKDDRHLAEATHYVVDKWQDTFDQPWVEESQAEFVERKRQLQQTLPERWKKGMEYVRHTAESKGAFEQRRGKLNDRVSAFLSRKHTEHREASRAELSIPYIPVPPIPAPKVLTARGVHRERLLQLRKTDTEEYTKQVAASSLLQLRKTDDDARMTVAAAASTESSEARKDQERIRFDVGRLNIEISAAFDALSDEDKAKLQQQADAHNAAQQQVVEEMKEPETEAAVKRLAQLSVLQDTLKAHWQMLSQTTGWVGTTIIGGVGADGEISLQSYQVGKDRQGLNLLEYLAKTWGTSATALENTALQWYYDVFHVIPMRAANADARPNDLEPPVDPTTASRLTGHPVPGQAPEASLKENGAAAEGIQGSGNLRSAGTGVRAAGDDLEPSQTPIAANEHPQEPTPARITPGAPSCPSTPVAGNELPVTEMPAPGTTSRANTPVALAVNDSPLRERSTPAPSFPSTPTRLSSLPKKSPAEKRRTSVFKKLTAKAAQEDASREYKLLCQGSQKELDDQWANGDTDIESSQAVIARLADDSQDSVYGMPLFPRTPRKTGLKANSGSRPPSPSKHAQTAGAFGPLGSPDRDALPVVHPSSAPFAETGDCPSPEGTQDPTAAVTAVRSAITREPRARKTGMPSPSDPPPSEGHQDPDSANLSAQTAPTRKARARKSAPAAPVEPTPSATDGEIISGRGRRQRKASKPFSPDDYNHKGGAHVTSISAPQPVPSARQNKRSKADSGPRKRSRR